LLVLGDVAAHGSRAEVPSAESRYGAARDLAAALGMTPLLERCDRALRDLRRAGTTLGARE
jgi:hypothetical protein